MPRSFLLLSVGLLLLAARDHGEDVDDAYVESPQILSQLLAAAQTAGEDLEPRVFADGGESYAYYPSAVSYLGTCDAAFGKVHVARLLYVRSRPIGRGIPPAHGHRFITFFDSTPKLIGFWRVDFDEEDRLLCAGTKLTFNGETIIDYAQPTKTKAAVIVDGKPQPVITW